MEEKKPAGEDRDRLGGLVSDTSNVAGLLNSYFAS